MKKRDIIEFEIGKMEFGGVSISQYGDRRIKMKGGIKGQKVKAAVKRTGRGKADVKMVELLERSPIETAEVCPHFEGCGGCTMLSVDYAKQLEIKEEQVLELFEDAGIREFEFLGVQGSPDNVGYRNKMEYTFGDEVKLSLIHI